MLLKSKLTAIIKRLDDASSLPKGDSRDDELQDIYNCMILVQQDNMAPYDVESLVIQDELDKLFTEDDARDYRSSVTPLIRNEQIEDSHIRRWKKILKAVLDKL